MLCSGAVTTRSIGAVAELRSIVAAVAEKHVARDRRGDDIFAHAPLPRLAADADLVLADRDRDLGAGRERAAAAGDGGAGDRHVAGIERLALEDVARPDEAGDELRARPRIDFLRRAELLDPAAVHHRDEIGGGHRLRLVVGHVDRGVAVGVVQAADLEAHLLAQVGIEVRQRLVEEQRLRLDDEGAGERDALLLAAGELAGIARGEIGELGGREDAGDLLGDLRARQLAQA